MNIKYIDTTTPQGMERAVLFEANNPAYKLVNGRLDFTWIFEKKEIVSNCCSANVVLTDICSDCLEHCKPIEI